MLTIERLKQVLYYDPESGIWTRLSCSSERWIGRHAGNENQVNGYRQIRIDGKLYRSNRLAWFYMTGKWPVYIVDHANRNRSDDRWINLRLATRSENGINTNISKNNKSGHTGVSWKKSCNKWVVQIGINRKAKHIGLYDSLDEAILAYQKTAKDLFGEFCQ